MRSIRGRPPSVLAILWYASSCSSSVDAVSRSRNRNSVRSSPQPSAPLATAAMSSITLPRLAKIPPRVHRRSAPRYGLRNGCALQPAVVGIDDERLPLSHLAKCRAHTDQHGNIHGGGQNGYMRGRAAAAQDNGDQSAPVERGQLRRQQI